MKKVCTKCKIEKLYNRFTYCNHTRDKLQSWCIDCGNEGARKHYKENKDKIREKNKKWDLANPRKRKSYRLQGRYGISIDDYEKMYHNCNGKCNICKEFYKKLHVDHAHITGKVRGLLCKACNVSLGNFKEDITRMEEAIAYLRRNLK
jgi:hypothetical protein